MDQHAINEAEWKKPENWSGSRRIFYFSKKDNRTWVPKSIPWMGRTINLAHSAGACWLLGFIIGLPLFIIALMALTHGK